MNISEESGYSMRQFHHEIYEQSLILLSVYLCRADNVLIDGTSGLQPRLFQSKTIWLVKLYSKPFGMLADYRQKSVEQLHPAGPFSL